MPTAAMKLDGGVTDLVVGIAQPAVSFASEVNTRSAKLRAQRRRRTSLTRSHGASERFEQCESKFGWDTEQ